jgi:hypothetical protein
VIRRIVEALHLQVLQLLEQAVAADAEVDDLVPRTEPRGEEAREALVDLDAPPLDHGVAEHDDAAAAWLPLARDEGPTIAVAIELPGAGLRHVDEVAVRRQHVLELTGLRRGVVDDDALEERGRAEDPESQLDPDQRDHQVQDEEEERSHAFASSWRRSAWPNAPITVMAAV